MPVALAEAEGYLRFLEDEQQATEYAEKWWNGLIDAFLSLQRMPQRCSVIPERKYFEEEVRHLMYQSHRIIFTVSGKKVMVLSVYHGAQRPLRQT